MKSIEMNSGGPLINLKGEVVGINTAIFSRTGGNIGIGFAVPVVLARAVMDQLIKFGEVRRGRLGISMTDVVGGEGASVAEVQANSPAAQAGLRMLWKGGNAVDAAIAAAAAMTICEPVSNGLGSDAFAILWDGKQLQGINGSGRAPAAWTPEYFRKKYGADAKTPPKRGIDSATVPGAVGTWVALSERYGKLPFADLLAPAIEIAERYSLVDVRKSRADEALDALRRTKIRGRKVTASRYRPPREKR